MATTVSPAEALEIIQKYNKESYHLRHALIVSGVMGDIAKQLGYSEADCSYWASVGMLHDIDFELYPDNHLENAPAMLREAGIGEDVIHAVLAHGWGGEWGVTPEHEMEKVLYAIDELTGLIWAFSRMRPSKSCQDMELSSLQKKYKDKKFAARCSREVIGRGAELLGWDIDVLLQRTLDAMKACESSVNTQMEKLENANA